MNSNKRKNLQSPVIKIAFFLYNLGWKIAIPLLKKNHRLKERFEERTLKIKLNRADLWIHAASAGESYLAEAILCNLKPEKKLKVLATSNTIQGLEILGKCAGAVSENSENIILRTICFSFDMPKLMEKAVNQIRPKVMVILETEIWPGLLMALKKYGAKILFLNARISENNLKKYMIWPSFWQSIKPDHISAVTIDDAKRFSKLFCTESSVMLNIKFDRIDYTGDFSEKKSPLQRFFGKNISFVVLGSVRTEEMDDIINIISQIRSEPHDTVIGLFPRHMHTIQDWERSLNSVSIKPVLRSSAAEPVSPGTVILWDVFGELGAAYKLADAAFVGGSLAPLGGQNFLEPLFCGIVPVIGPYWDNFFWVGSEIFEQNLAKKAAGWKEVAFMLIEYLKSPPDRQSVLDAAYRYIKDRQGGVNHACKIISEFLN